MDFRGFDSSIILILRGGLPRPIGDFPESSSQAMLVGTMLVGKLGVQPVHIYRGIGVSGYRGIGLSGYRGIGVSGYRVLRSIQK